MKVLEEVVITNVDDSKIFEVILYGKDYEKVATFKARKFKTDLIPTKKRMEKRKCH